MTDHVRDPRDKGEGGGCGCTFSPIDVELLTDRFGRRSVRCPVCGTRLDPHDVVAWLLDAIDVFLEDDDGPESKPPAADRPN
jgi:hypothetical protein